MTRFGRSVLSPAARRFARHRHSSAIPPSMHASLEPVVEQPTACSYGAFHRWPMMFTQRCSSSAVCGYSSLSIMFLDAHSAISSSASGSIHVVTNVARFSLALPSRMSSSLTTWSAVRGSTPLSGSRYRGISQLFSRKYSGLMSSSTPDSSSGTFLCSAAMAASLVAARSPGANRGTRDPKDVEWRRLLQQLLHRPEGRVTGVPEPFEQHHLSADDLRAVLPCAVDREGLVRRITGSGRVGGQDHPHPRAEQAEDGLQHAHVRLAAGDDDLPRSGPAQAVEAGGYRGGERRLDEGRAWVGGELRDGVAEALRVLLGGEDRHVEQCRRLGKPRR